MDQNRLTRDSIRIQIVCGDSAALIRKISEVGILLWNVEVIDYLTVRFACASKDKHSVRRIALKFGSDIQVLTDGAAGNFLYRMLKRPLIAASILIFMTLVLFLPTRVLFIRVEGNVSVPDNLILEQAEICGIRFGASRRLVRSEKIKNALLAAMPELQWAGVNTNGCVATVSVREKTQEESEKQSAGSGSIVAVRDGVVKTCIVQNGTALCSPGDAVITGQVLVSGYTDCGIAIKVVRAQAEITADTIHKMLAVTPTYGSVRDGCICEEIKYSLRVGKKLINFFKDSGISDTSCVKMYSEECLTLPGGFELPVALITQRCTYYSEYAAQAVNVDSWMGGYCRAYLLDHMQAGQILQEHTLIEEVDGVYSFYGEYTCLESIGQFISEEIIKDD